MASDVERRITLRALYDGTQLKQGTDEAETHLEALERATADTSDDINRSLRSIDDGVSSTFGSSGSFARSVDDVEASGGRLKNVGGEIGSEFSENIGEGIRSGDLAGTLLETFTSLGPALGVAGIGIAAGAGIINGIVQGARAEREKFKQLVNDLFTSVEVRAETSTRKIQQSLIDAFSFKDALAEAGDGDEAAGFSKVKAVAEELGVKVGDVVDVIRNKWTPASLGVLELMRDYGDKLTFVDTGQGRISSVLAEQTGWTRDLLELSERRTRANQTNIEMLRSERDYLAANAGHSKTIASNSERTASANQRAADAASRMADAYRTAAQQRLPDNLW